jgi:hypothetical protein
MTTGLGISNLASACVVTVCPAMSSSTCVVGCRREQGAGGRIWSEARGRGPQRLAAGLAIVRPQAQRRALARPALLPVQTRRAGRGRTCAVRGPASLAVGAGAADADEIRKTAANGNRERGEGESRANGLASSRRNACTRQI